MEKPCARETCSRLADGNSDFCKSHNLDYRRCKIETCESWGIHSGYCAKHGGVSWKKRCKVKNCTTFVWKMGYCYAHSDKNHPRVRHIAVKKILKCSERNCRAPVAFDNVCVKHGRQKGLQCHQYKKNKRRCRNRVEEGSKRCKSCTKL